MGINFRDNNRINSLKLKNKLLCYKHNYTNKLFYFVSPIINFYSEKGNNTPILIDI